MQQGLELERNVAIVGDDQGGVQAVPVKHDAVDESKLVGPQLLGLFRNALGGEAKVELDTGAGALAGGLAKKLPSRVTGEAVLAELGGGLVIGGGSKDLREWLLVSRLPATGCSWRTGKTMGIPPRTGALPSRAAASLTQSFSLPEASFQLMTVAP